MWYISIYKTISVDPVIVAAAFYGDRDILNGIFYLLHYFYNFFLSFIIIFHIW